MMLKNEQLTFDTAAQTGDGGSIFHFAKNASVVPVTCHMSIVKCSSATRARGFGLVEIIVAASILSMAMLAVSTYFHATFKMNRATSDGNQANYLLEEGVEALKLNRDVSYLANLLPLSTTTPRYFSWNNTGAKWEITNIDTLIDGNFERKFTISDVYRDNITFDISTSTTGVTYDPNVKLAKVTVSWLSGIESAGRLTPLTPASVPIGDSSYSGANEIVISPDSKFLYVQARKNNREYVFVYTRDLGTGNLTKTWEVDTGVATSSSGYGIGISPDGSSVYAPAYMASVVLQYSRDPATGALSAIGSGSVGTGNHPIYVVVSPDGTSVYVSNYGNQSISQYSRNTSTGALSPLNPATVSVANCLDEMSMSSDGKSLYLAASCDPKTLSQLSRDTATGKLTSLGPVGGIGDTTAGPTVSPDGNFVYTVTSIDELDYVLMYRRDSATSYLTPLSPQTANTARWPVKIKLSPDGFFAYVANYGGNNISQFSRDVTTGLLTPLSPATVSAGTTALRGLAISPDGNSLYTSGYYGNAIYQYRRDPGMTTRSIQTYITNLFNSCPIANAGVDQSTNSTAVTLNGSATDLDGTISSYVWSQVSGPVSATITSPTNNTTTVTGLSVSGTYVFRLTSKDNLDATGYDDMSVVVGTIENGHYFVDFGYTPTNTIGWNNPALNLTTHNAIVDSVGISTSVTLFFTAAVGHSLAVNTNGTTASTLYPSTATSDSIFVDKTASLGPTSLSFDVEGLNTAFTYTFRFYASRKPVVDNRTTNYTVGGTTVALNAANNENSTVSISGIIPNASGKVTVTVAPAASSNQYGYLGVVEITKN